MPIADGPPEVKEESPRKTAEEILAVQDTQTEEVPVREWGTSVKVIGLTKRQQIDIRKSAMVDGEPDPEKVQQGIWLEGVVEPKFTAAQLPGLFEKNAGAVDTVLAKILALSGMTEEAVKRQEATFRK